MLRFGSIQQSSAQARQLTATPAMNNAPVRRVLLCRRSTGDAGGGFSLRATERLSASTARCATVMKAEKLL
jgi:hypothetical protein